MEELGELLDEVRLMWHVMVRSTERLHAGERITAGMRAVLEMSARHGPATVPQMARRRRVTRQHIQARVDELLAAGLVELGPNPAHRSSALVRLTPGGRQAIARMLRRERRWFSRLDLAPPVEKLRAAAATLRGVREGFEGAL